MQMRGVCRAGCKIFVLAVVVVLHFFLQPTRAVSDEYYFASSSLVLFLRYSLSLATESNDGVPAPDRLITSCRMCPSAVYMQKKSASKAYNCTAQATPWTNFTQAEHYVIRYEHVCIMLLNHCSLMRNIGNRPMQMPNKTICRRKPLAQV